MKALLKLTAFLFTPATIALLALLFTTPFFVYSRFDAESVIAELEFQPVDEQSFIALLSTDDLCTTNTYLLKGDQWQLDAQFLKWHGIGVLLGLDSRYRLDRLNGRFENITQQTATPPTSHDLKTKIAVDWFSLGKNDAHGLMIDSQYGSSVYMRIDPALRYRVFKTEDGLIARTEPRAKQAESNGVLSIDIERACLRETGWTEKMSRRLNELAIKLLD